MTVEHIGGTAPLRRLDVVLTGLSSDAHTWNLVYLELLLEEMGCRVTNLGACTPDVTIVRACATRRPNLLVVSSLNGHGVQDGVRLIRALRAEPGPFRNHTDAELIMLEELCGREPPFIKGGQYPSRKY